MIAIVLRWHQATSWKLGRRHGAQGKPYNRPWWANEANYALAYTYAKLIETPWSTREASVRLREPGMETSLQAINGGRS
jgi:hypothetical protein